ncbi:urease accessory protein UreD [Paractinoplanes atraurantiacus]|uniref:Urease accessory protein UreD n=1 Tax=Paractinoplanes atraurantiacus TaxID=1036182 RepID=A0A285J6S1_9ACTN|nr:urease accessory protein UreD [Actinoplanes atraurantiacus]SNY56015.1 urease accessory protein [Actinoplanes atraurantiacus]
MKAFARVAAESDGRGGTRLAELRGESPLLPRRTGAHRVHLVGGAAGPLRGDELRLEIAVGPGATLEVLSVAAQLALPGRSHLPASRYEISASVAEGGELRWLPEPLIAAAGCDHVTVTHVDVADGGHLLWRDDLVCGRHGEDPGDVRTETTVRYAGRTLYRHDLAVGPAAPGWSGAAVLGGGRALGTVVMTTEDGPAVLGGDAVLMPLAGPGMVGIAVGADIRQVRAALDPLCAARVAVATPAG